MRYGWLVGCMLAGVIAGSSVAVPAKAHEFWIMPEEFRPAQGVEVEIELLEGDAFSGKSIGYHTRRFHLFDLMTPLGMEPVKSRNDTIPAAKIRFSEPGLNVLIYQSKLGLVTYDSLDEFETFLGKMKLDWGLAEHAARGLPDGAIREAYFRYAKALVAVGDGEAGADRLIGMPLELVALGNPYEAGSSLRVQLFYKEEIYAEQPIFVFRRGPNGLEHLWYETNAEGIAEIPLVDGTEFQINAVHLQPASERMTKVFGAVWQTLWASMTFDLKP